MDPKVTLTPVSVPEVIVQDPNVPGYTYHLRDPAHPDHALCGTPVANSVPWHMFSAKPCTCCIQERLNK